VGTPKHFICLIFQHLQQCGEHPHQEMASYGPVGMVLHGFDSDRPCWHLESGLLWAPSRLLWMAFSRSCCVSYMGRPK